MFTLHQGDCLQVLKTIPDASIDAVVTDPPYGLSFMGKKWDYDVPSAEIWREVLRVLKPGGHLLSFAGTRTQHRMAVNIEDAGFEIRDMIAWIYGSGFPKSLNIEKAGAGPDWEGWGTALKPALEPITVARKPLIGTVAENVLTHGTGGLNIDGCRVGETGARFNGRKVDSDIYGKYGTSKPREDYNMGRFPANLIHDGSDEVVGLFPYTKSGKAEIGTGNDVPQNIYGKYAQKRITSCFADKGSAARFFYCAKASKKDRDEGLEGFALKKAGAMSGAEYRPDKPTNHPMRANNHPTVKPTDLMRYLCRLVTPPGGTVLDPFMGSGSTGKAAIMEGFHFIGIEREAEYVEIARARISATQPPLAA